MENEIYTKENFGWIGWHYCYTLEIPQLASVVAKYPHNDGEFLGEISQLIAENWGLC